MDLSLRQLEEAVSYAARSMLSRGGSPGLVWADAVTVRPRGKWEAGNRHTWRTSSRPNAMKIDDLWQQQQQYPRDVTEHSRKLAFAVAAICWFFKSPDTTFPPAILGALIFLVGFFVADVTHYFWAAVRYRRFNYRAEEQL